MMSDTRLIERWLPIAAIGEESARERRSLQALPPVYYLHVWWARRPLVAARAAILASLLPENSDRSSFLHAIGIHGDPIESRRRIDAAKRRGLRFEGEAYTYPRAFSHNIDHTDRDYFTRQLGSTGRDRARVLDPTAGGGSVPLEALRMGFEVISNDINPVAVVVQKATFEYPRLFKADLSESYLALAREFVRRRDDELSKYFPIEKKSGAVATNFIWARTIRCPYCEGVVPLSPNWKLAPDGAGIRLHPHQRSGPGDQMRCCSFDIVQTQLEQSSGTVTNGDATCPFLDCQRIISGEDVKRQAQAGDMGDQMCAVVVRHRVSTTTKSGKRGRDKWVQVYRSPCDDDNVEELVSRALSERMEEWTVLDIVPSEEIDHISNYDRGHRMYGMETWRALFSPRQLLTHGTSVQIFRQMVDEARLLGPLSEIQRATFIYLSIALDKLINWNARQSTWNVNLEGMRSVFDTHNFSMKWSYAEMSPISKELGRDWAIEQCGKGIRELVALFGDDDNLFSKAGNFSSVDPIISCGSGDALPHVVDGSIDAVVIDPPYYDNVMYGELSDFFYVWLKRTAGYVLPELFTRRLVDKENEAVANPAKFQGQSGAKALAGRDYQDRMAGIFAECRRVLKHDGIMTLMFTHKATGAWDALTKSLIEAGFSISASWPINTEAESSLHIKDKSAANSTIFLVCRPRKRKSNDTEINYWEDVEPEVIRAVLQRVPEFQASGITGVDLYLASFGPALEEFSKHWPLRRGTPRAEPVSRKRRKQAAILDESFDPYAVMPEDALEAARRVVKTWRLNQLMHMRGKEDLDPVTTWFVLAWDAFKAPVFAYDEALRLAHAVGIDLDSLVGRLCEKKGSDLKIWDSATRAAKGTLGPADGSRGMIDVIHHVAHLSRTRTVEDARELLGRNSLATDPSFLNAFEAVLEVLPPSKTYLGFDLVTGEAKASADDFDALERLRRVAFAEAIDQPKQLELFAKEAADVAAAANAA